MDDSDVERIVSSMEKQYGKGRIEFASRNQPYRTVLLDQFLYHSASESAKEKILERRGQLTSAKQDYKVKLGMKAWVRYGHITHQGINAIKYLIKKGVKV